MSGMTELPDLPATLRDGRYQLGAPLGAGGMAVVVQAHDTQLGVDRAIKVLLPDMGRPSVRRRLQNEARAMARLGHPHLFQRAGEVKSWVIEGNAFPSEVLVDPAPVEPEVVGFDVVVPASSLPESLALVSPSPEPLSSFPAPSVFSPQAGARRRAEANATRDRVVRSKRSLDMEPLGAD